MKRSEIYFDSASSNKIYQVIIAPDKEIKGYIQFICDIYDYIDRYVDVMKTLANVGYVCFGMDLPGHGKSKVDEYGNMNHYKLNEMLQDIHQAYVETLKLYVPDFAPIPIKDRHGKESQLLKPQLHAMVGVGFGCSVIRSYCNRYNDVNALVMVGDMAFNSRYTKLLKICQKEMKKQGGSASSEDIRELLQQKYNDHFSDNRLYRNSYRSSILANVRQINADRACNFEYNLESMTFILSVLSQFSIVQWLNVFPKYMPLYEMAGYDDPVNNYTRELDDLLIKFRRTNSKNIFHKYYEHSRHEVLFEKTDIMKDMRIYFDSIHRGMMAAYKESLDNLTK